MKKQEFIQGIKDGIPICLGYFSVSMAFGLSVVLAGMPLWSAVLTSLTNVTSAGQFAGVNLMLKSAPFFEIFMTTVVINMRYFLMSLSVSQKVSSEMTMMQRLAVSFGITDEIFAVSMQHKGDLTAVYMFGLILTPVFGWTMGTLTGAVATSVMPPALSSAMGIALYGMFIAIIMPDTRKEKSVLFTVLAAIGASYAFTYLPLLNKLSSGWVIIIIAIGVSALAATLFPIQVEDEAIEDIVDIIADEATEEVVEEEKDETAEEIVIDKKINAEEEEA